MTNFLHIYGQDIWHGDAYIVGDTEGLTKLRMAIDAALNNTEHTANLSVVTYAGDGEGYAVRVSRAESKHIYEKRLRMPYTDECAVDKRSDVIHPGYLPLEALDQ